MLCDTQTEAADGAIVTKSHLITTTYCTGAETLLIVKIQIKASKLILTVFASVGINHV